MKKERISYINIHYWNHWTAFKIPAGYKQNKNEPNIKSNFAVNTFFYRKVYVCMMYWLNLIWFRNFLALNQLKGIQRPTELKNEKNCYKNWWNKIYRSIDRFKFKQAIYFYYSQRKELNLFWIFNLNWWNLSIEL